MFVTLSSSTCSLTQQTNLEKSLGIIAAIIGQWHKREKQKWDGGDYKSLLSNLFRFEHFSLKMTQRAAEIHCLREVTTIPVDLDILQWAPVVTPFNTFSIVSTNCDFTIFRFSVFEISMGMHMNSLK